MKKLEVMGVQEMDVLEMKEKEGGYYSDVLGEFLTTIVLSGEEMEQMGIRISILY